MHSTKGVTHATQSCYAGKKDTLAIASADACTQAPTLLQCWLCKHEHKWQSPQDARGHLQGYLFILRLSQHLLIRHDYHWRLLVQLKRDLASPVSSVRGEGIFLCL